MGNYRNNPFSKPKGFKGKLAGFLMTYGKGNRFRQKWAIHVMQIQPADVLLEIGFGTGAAIQEVSNTVTSGSIYGIDESDVMVETAIKRNKVDIVAKKIILYHASVNNLPVFKKKIDKVFTINSFEFWEDKVNALFNVKERMSQKGQMFIFHQILNSKGEPPINELRDMYSEDFRQSGFKNIIIENNLTPEILCVKAVPE